MQRQVVGTSPEGETVEELVLTGGGLTAHVLTWGACLRDLRLEGHPAPLVLGFENFAPYPEHSRNFGAIVGRCANRIRAGKFRLEGRDYQLDLNDGANHLHGGSRGVGRRVWQVAEHAPGRLRLTLEEPDGWMGYPGACRFAVTYALPGDGTLLLRLEAEADAPTVVNLSAHSYFNLDGGPTIDGHRLRIAADRFLPVDEARLPTGAVQPVAGTPLDFREGRALEPGGDEAPILDFNLCLAGARGPLREVAWLSSPRSGVSMTLATTEPGLQLYNSFLLDCPMPGLGGRRYGPRAGLCLEPQVWPDAINQPDFPNPVLRPGQAYLHQTSYRFALAG